MLFIVKRVNILRHVEYYTTIQMDEIRLHIKMEDSYTLFDRSTKDYMLYNAILRNFLKRQNKR